MFSLGWAEGGEAWVLSLPINDSGSHDPVKGYSVSGVYQLLTSRESVTLDAAEDHLWHKQMLTIVCPGVAVLNQ
ncbi:hypothetical protein A2U01_0022521 [Trifolium medium]|uniref:Uncharacterized protein n=1 Tax=Trifolium medium TaxID=97028 RepID=A0A392NSP1_9FABA|nr:hypothetical protein [Trifolium medium]